MKIVTCDLCSNEISEEKCAFAVEKRIIDGKEYHFCCRNHAERFERKQK